MLDEIHVPLEAQVKGNIDFLARDFANWISRSNSGIAASKLGLLCTRDFQVAASSILEDSFIKDVRLLIWTTTLAYTAQGLGSKSSQQQNEALSNLKRFRNSRGDRVVRSLDRLCRPQNIQHSSPLQRKLLFLVILGVSLSATYTVYCSVHCLFHPN